MGGGEWGAGRGGGVGVPDEVGGMVGGGGWRSPTALTRPNQNVQVSTLTEELRQEAAATREERVSASHVGGGCVCVFACVCVWGGGGSECVCGFDHAISNQDHIFDRPPSVINEASRLITSPTHHVTESIPPPPGTGGQRLPADPAPGHRPHHGGHQRAVALPGGGD
jgi:hypothetical protein